MERRPQGTRTPWGWITRIEAKPGHDAQKVGLVVCRFRLRRRFKNEVGDI